MICKTEKAAVTLSKEFYLGCNENMEEETNRFNRNKIILARNTLKGTKKTLFSKELFKKKWVKMINVK
jgi:hypothetical protein